MLFYGSGLRSAPRWLFPPKNREVHNEGVSMGIEHEARASWDALFADGRDIREGPVALSAYLDGYIAGASRPVTDEEVEIAAAAYWPHNPAVTPHEWATLPEYMKRSTRSRTRRALEALRQL